MQNSVDGPKAVSAESAMNEELVKLADKEGDQLHRELAHRIRVLTVNLSQCAPTACSGAVSKPQKKMKKRCESC